jgi:hypothetical protein
MNINAFPVVFPQLMTLMNDMLDMSFQYSFPLRERVGAFSWRGELMFGQPHTPTSLIMC